MKKGGRIARLLSKKTKKNRENNFYLSKKKNMSNFRSFFELNFFIVLKQLDNKIPILKFLFFKQIVKISTKSSLIRAFKKYFINFIKINFQKIKSD